MITTGTDVRNWMQRHGFTHDTAAIALGVSRPTIYRLITSKKVKPYIGLACAAIDANLQPIHTIILKHTE